MLALLPWMPTIIALPAILLMVLFAHTPLPPPPPQVRLSRTWIEVPQHVKP